jgi:transposase
MALFVGLDVSLKTTSVCVVAADGSPIWEGKAESEPTAIVKVLIRWREEIVLVGIEACPLSEWLYGALVESGFNIVCIETRHAQRFLSSRPNKRVPIWGDRSFRQHQQVRRQNDAARALRSGELAFADLEEVVGAAGVGRKARQAHRRQESMRCGGA